MLVYELSAARGADCGTATLFVVNDDQQSVVVLGHVGWSGDGNGRSLAAHIDAALGRVSEDTMPPGYRIFTLRHLAAEISDILATYLPELKIDGDWGYPAIAALLAEYDK